jgi:methionine-rich copper-binding protein CopC
MYLRAAIAALFLLSGASISSARPLLEHASPGVGSTVRHAPREIALSFNEVLLPSGSDAVVRKASGGLVSAGKARVVGNKTHMQVPVKSLPPGKYRVEWYATSADRHSSQGSFNFIIGSRETVGRGTPPAEHHRGH